MESGAQLLAAARTAGTKNAAATHSLLASEEAMTTGTHEIAGLESTLHDNT